MKHARFVMATSIAAAAMIASSLAMHSCAPSKPELAKVGAIAEGQFDPEEWGKVYPLHYESWLKTGKPKKAGTSFYRRGWDDDKVIYDRLSEYPFSALLYSGWGFGIEYNEPRGHLFAVNDQLEVDPSRVKSGGVCLACKNPYHKTYTEKYGMKYLTAGFTDAVNMIPEKHRKLGPSCIDCHKPATMGLTTNKPHISRGLELIGKKELSRQEGRIMACCQCHITYFVPRDRDKKVTGDVQTPWKGSAWGDISIEKIIADLLSDYSRIEWKQAVTGLDMPFIRHPEFELFTKSSVHFKAGAACADCHMPFRRTGSYKISDHDVMSPLKSNMRACSQCHTESAEWLGSEVRAIQDRTASLLLRAGYATATAAKLIERLNAEEKRGLAPDAALKSRAVRLYKEAFLRVVFIGAENSTGFHNPTEAGRVLGDSIAYASKSESLLRQLLAAGGVSVPEKVDLELGKYLNGRGKKKLNFRRDQMVPDPFGTQKEFSQLP